MRRADRPLCFRICSGFVHDGTPRCDDKDRSDDMEGPCQQPRRAEDLLTACLDEKIATSLTTRADEVGGLDSGGGRKHAQASWLRRIIGITVSRGRERRLVAVSWASDQQNAVLLPLVRCSVARLTKQETKRGVNYG